MQRILRFLYKSQLLIFYPKIGLHILKMSLVNRKNQAFPFPFSPLQILANSREITGEVGTQQALLSECIS